MVYITLYAKFYFGGENYITKKKIYKRELLLFLKKEIREIFFQKKRNFLFKLEIVQLGRKSVFLLSILINIKILDFKIVRFQITNFIVCITYYILYY